MLFFLFFLAIHSSIYQFKATKFIYKPMHQLIYTSARVLSTTHHLHLSVHPSTHLLILLFINLSLFQSIQVPYYMSYKKTYPSICISTFSYCLLIIVSFHLPVSPIISYFSFQPVLHIWCNKGRGMCYPVCGMMHIKEPLLLIGKSSPGGGSGFPLSCYLNGPLPYV